MAEEKYLNTPKIQDMNIYTSRMVKGMDDKLFFIPFLSTIKTPILFVDFGCADGTLLKYLLNIHPTILTIGIDNSKDMYAFAQKTLADYMDRFQFYTSLDEFRKDLKIYQNKYTIILNLSSVLHEVHHYSSNEEISRFYQELNNIPFDYIFIRDMYCQNTSSFYTKSQDYEIFTNHIQYKQPNKNLETQLKQFEDCFGSVKLQKNFLHFLMKYKYIENWDRECQENYFADIRFDQIKRCYDEIFRKEYQLPYLKELWNQELNIELDENTHIKCIYKRKG